MRFAYEDHIEELGAGDLLTIPGRGHGMIATGGEPCTFLAVVAEAEREAIIQAQRSSARRAARSRPSPQVCAPKSMMIPSVSRRILPPH